VGVGYILGRRVKICSLRVWLSRLEYGTLTRPIRCVRERCVGQHRLGG